MCCGSWFKIDGFGWDHLEFKDCDEDCDVCGEPVTRKLEFPTKCGHSFCISCCKNILFFDSTRYTLNPVNYGCPPCPNGCSNPEKGKQCDCMEYDEIQLTWKEEYPDEYDFWFDEQRISIETGETTEGCVYGSCKCPMCRREYRRG